MLVYVNAPSCDTYAIILILSMGKLSFKKIQWLPHGDSARSNWWNENYIKSHDSRIQFLSHSLLTPTPLSLLFSCRITHLKSQLASVISLRKEQWLRIQIMGGDQRSCNFHLPEKKTQLLKPRCTVSPPASGPGVFNLGTVAFGADLGTVGCWAAALTTTH